MFWRPQLFIYSLIFLVGLLHVSAAWKNEYYKNNSVVTNIETLLQLMDLHSKVCDRFSFCTVKPYPLNVIEGGSTSDCCKQCSCNNDCFQSESCCPDYWLRHDILQNYSYESVSELRHSIYMNRNNLAAANVSIPKFPFTDLEYKECVSEIFGSSSSVDHTIFQMTSYVMVTSCPVGTNPDLAQKCKMQLNQTERLLSYSVDAVIPVFSNLTRRTYKNRFCQECHEYLSTNIPFEIYLTCRLTNDLNYYLKSPLEVLKLASSGGVVGCYIKYKPPSIIENDVQMCQSQIIDTCPGNATQDTEFLTDLCRLFYLPVSVMRSFPRVDKTFRNVACYLCNMNRTYQRLCGELASYQTPFSVQIGTETAQPTADATRPDLNDGFKFKNLVNIPQEGIITCENDTVFDAITNTCRKIWCPQLMFTHHDRCLHVIHKMENMHIVTMLTITPKDKSLSQDTLNYTEQLNTMIDETARATFANYSYGLWMDKDVRNGALHFVWLAFIPKSNYQMTYADSKEELLQFINLLESLLLHVDETHVGVNVKMTTKYINRYNGIIHRLTGKRLDVVQRYEGNSFQYTIPLIISVSHFCVRVGLLRSEVKALGPHINRVKSSNKTIYDVYIEKDGQRNLILTCAENYFIYNTPGVRKIRKTTNLDVTRSMEHANDYQLTGVYIIIAIGVVLVVLAIVCFKWRR